MPRITKEVTIQNAQGLHARPAAMFVQIASKYDSSVTIQKDEEKVNGKSIMGILTLGAQKGTIVILEATGEDAQSLIDDLVNLLSSEQMQ